MAIKRVDKLRNTANVLKERLKDPTQTTRDIAKKIGIDHSTVARIDKELPQIATKEKILTDLVSVDIEIQELAQKEMKRRLKETPQEVNGADLKGFSEITLKRSQLLTGQATDRDEVILKWDV